jgi:peptidoglycan-N-acetylglucosamine deacetylase
MKWYWIKTPQIIKRIFSNQIWAIPNSENKVYLTFDDGPTPEITEWVLDFLKTEKIKATFFCIGKNIENNPEIFNKIITDGHAFGNHTFNHIKGWETNETDYIENTQKCQIQIETQIDKKQKSTQLFRPPYGKIKPAQSKKLRKLGYKIIMWDVLSADFDKISSEKCLQNVIKNTKSGSIIVFHDSQKATVNMRYALTKSIEILKQKGFVFDVIS